MPPNKAVTDPMQQDAIVAEYLAKRELEQRQRRQERWLSVVAWIPMALVAVFYVAMAVMLHESLSPYLPLAAAAGFVVFDAQRRIARLEKKLDQVLEELKRTKKGATDA